MAGVTDHECFAASGYHRLDPQRFFLPTFELQVCQFANMMHLTPLMGPTEFACVREESLGQLISAWLSRDGRGYILDVSPGLSFQCYTSEASY